MAGSGKPPALHLTNISINLTVEIRISIEKDKSEPVPDREKVRIIFACPNCTKKIFSADLCQGLELPKSFCYGIRQLPVDNRI